MQASAPVAFRPEENAPPRRRSDRSGKKESEAGALGSNSPGDIRVWMALRELVQRPNTIAPHSRASEEHESEPLASSVSPVRSRRFRCGSLVTPDVLQVGGPLPRSRRYATSSRDHRSCVE